MQMDPCFDSTISSTCLLASRCEKQSSFVGTRQSVNPSTIYLSTLSDNCEDDLMLSSTAPTRILASVFFVFIVVAHGDDGLDET